MKLLIAPDKQRFYNLKQFGDALTKFNIEYKLVDELEIYDNENVGKFRWFQTPKKFRQLINEFKPDAVLGVRVAHFSLLTLKSKIPLLLYLIGDYWSERNWFNQTTHASLERRIELWQKRRWAEKCFRESKMIFPICNYLEKIVINRYPAKKIRTLYQGINVSDWHDEKKMELKHPCVGLLQGANIWVKTKEMLELRKVLESFPNVTFYWAGDGSYKNKILAVLEKYDNFKWFGSLQFPEKVMEYLAGIDVYALLSGQDMFPHTLLEAAAMQKPIVATNVGGISESMVNGKTGFLYEKGDIRNLIEKISLLLNDESKSKQMGSEGRKFVEENFSWDKIAKDVSTSIKNLES